MSLRFQFAIGFILLACAALWTLSPPTTVQGAQERSANTDLVVQDSIAFTKLPDPAVLPVGSTLGAAFSHDSAYLAVGVTHTMPNEPHLLIYKRNGDTFTKLADPMQPGGIISSVTFSHDSTYLAVGHSASPYVSIYKRSGDTFTKLPNPDALPPLSGLSVAFNSDSTYLAVGHNNDPYLTIYKRSGDTFTRHANVVGKPGGNGNSVAFTPDDSHLVVGHWSTRQPCLVLFQLVEDTFTIQPNPADQPGCPVQSVAFSPDGIHMALSHASFVSGRPSAVVIYGWDGESLTPLPDTGITLPGLGRDLTYSTDGAYLAIAHDAGAKVSVYSRSGDTYTRLPDPDVPPGGANGNAVAFSPDGAFLVLGHNVLPNFSIYKIGPANQNLYLPSVLK